ncbi:MAG: FKBP-type peptidyl-prolyl cis-trans isomerase [Gemmatimonadetes bacterium]|nr:FKBP-type peptidyl-prolyl cis-trans isomerase [Gemmatimonadota bacterium]
MRVLFRALLCALPLLAVGCGDASGPNDPDLRKVAFAPALGVDIASMTRVGDGVYVKDLTVGTGADVNPNKVISVRYQGWLADGTRFDHNLDPRAPFQLVLSQGRVIAGWTQGIPGMKVGGKRLLVIPPSLGYGDRPNGPIPANSVLVFEVEVISQSS